MLTEPEGRRRSPPAQRPDVGQRGCSKRRDGGQRPRWSTAPATERRDAFGHVVSSGTRRNALGIVTSGGVT